jgi:hypothetical protein
MSADNRPQSQLVAPYAQLPPCTPALLDLPEAHNIQRHHDAAVYHQQAPHIKHHCIEGTIVTT